MSKLKQVFCKKIVMIILCILLFLSLFIIIFFVSHQKKYSRVQNEMKQEVLNETFGMLILGSDLGATQTNGGNHTDSLTYATINLKTGKAVLLPIYRDALILDVCQSSEKNINHIYRDSGVGCLKKSFEKAFDLPVKHYIYITADGFVDFFNVLPKAKIIAQETFCSNFGNDDKQYCFSEGIEYEMNGNELLAFARYRGNSSGLVRAQRNTKILPELYNVCTKNKNECLTSIFNVILQKKIQTDIPFTMIMSKDNPLYFEVLTVLQGENYEDNQKIWHQSVNREDLQKKREKLLENLT